MKKTLLAMAAVAALYTTGAMAQSMPAGVYVGLGGDWAQSTAKGANSTGAANLKAGYDFNKYLATELDVSAGFANGNQRANTATMLNVLAGVPVDLAGFKVKPYAMVGTGYDFAYAHGSNNINTVPAYNVGGGLEYDINKNVSVDVRYTYVDGYNKNSTSANVVGMSVNYKF